MNPQRIDNETYESALPSSLTKRFFTGPEDTPATVFDSLSWERRDAIIRRFGSQETVFEQKDIEVPVSWSDQALQIVAQKYFKGPLGSPKRETSIRQLIERVVNWIGMKGIERGYLSHDEAASFTTELTYLLVHQMVSFNSPVWFNVGTEFSSNPEKPQCSACFINSVEDEMDGEHGILSVFVREGRIFKDGSGSGINLFKLRSSKEFLSSGGRPSGPVSFMRGFDVNAGQIKSGGKTRRAAKMVILNSDHGDIQEFITCKAKEEKRAQQLIGLGYSSSFDDPNGAYGLVFFQNANHTVRTVGSFMQAVEKDQPYKLMTRDGQLVLETVPARELFRSIAQAAWECGDPGIQFDDVINHWNPVLDTQRINGSNPCSEYMFIDDSACNLASFNLMKYKSGPAGFDFWGFRASCHTMILAMDILVGASGYPTPRIEQNSHDYRPLGLGYANLGSLLMTSGFAYDSPAGRTYAGAVTSLMCAAAYEQSIEIAKRMGPFAYWQANQDSFLRVLEQHREASSDLTKGAAHGTRFEEMSNFAEQIWTENRREAAKFGVRNAQVTVLAPTGTIGYMMDCQTTGVEPELGLIKYKTLVGGGTLTLVNRLVPETLRTLGYSDDEGLQITEYVTANETIEGAPHLLDEHLGVFDTSFPAKGSTRSIEPMGHVRMMGAVQPFLSGAISKTVNMPEDATVSDIENVYLEAWRMGLKAVAVYRNNCKKSQPLSMQASEGVATKTIVVTAPKQRKMPDERQAFIKEVTVGGQKIFLTVGLYEDGTPGEIFIDTAKEGTQVSGLYDVIGILTSVALQYGVPLEKLVSLFSYVTFDPAGITSDRDIRFARSIPDFIFRFLDQKFLTAVEETVETAKVLEPSKLKRKALVMEERLCTDCGNRMTPNGSCYRCTCGATSGCS